jgi:hypothetical protein
MQSEIEIFESESEDSELEIGSNKDESNGRKIVNHNSINYFCVMI